MPRLTPPDPPLGDDSVLLRTWVAEDAAAVTAACQDPEIPRWTVVPSPYTEAEARAFIGGCGDAIAAGLALDLAVTAADNGRLLGAVGVTSFDWANRRAEIGYWVAREARGRGVARRAVRLLSDWVLRDLAFERLELLAHPHNHASQRVAEAAGFTREGTLRLYRRRHGVREDLVMYSLLDLDLHL
jgi:RimJ/RimL family protein N-acetyltransferase